MKYLLHFAMIKECPRDLLVLPKDFDGDYDNIAGLVDTSDPNIKVWISGVGCNNVLFNDSEVIDYIKSCDYIYSFGLAGSIFDNLKVGDFVNIHSVNNLDVKIPHIPMCTTESFISDTLGLSKSSLTSLADFNNRVLCFTSNRFVTKEYLDFLFSSGEDSMNDFFLGMFDCTNKELLIDYTINTFNLDNDSVSKYDIIDEDEELEYYDSASSKCLVCDMELFYLAKLVDIINPMCIVYSYKLISDVVCKENNYKDYECSLDSLLSTLYFNVRNVFKELSSKGD